MNLFTSFNLLSSPRRSHLLVVGALSLLGITGIGFTPNANAQDATTPAIIAPTLTAKPALTGKMKVLADLFKAGLYDKAIAQATSMMKAAPDGDFDPVLFYYRGWAELCVGWYDQAQDDLEQAAQNDVEKTEKDQIGIFVGGRTVAQALQDIADTREHLPPQVEDIKDPADPNTTLFHVYYTEKDEFVQTVLDALMLAYRIDAPMYGARLTNQTVVIFDTADQEAAYRALGGQELFNWTTAYSTLTGLHLCEQNSQGGPLQQSKEQLTGLVVHEYNHCILRHTMGKVKLPQWFIEGLAMCAQGQVVPGKADANNRKIVQLIRAGLLAPMDELEESDSFKEIKTASRERELEGVKGVQPSPYDQAYSMARFLLSQLGANQLPKLLNEIYKAKNYEKGLDATLGMTPSEFYDAWSDTVLPQVPVPNTGR